MSVIDLKKQLRDALKGPGRLKFLYAGVCEKQPLNEKRILFESFHGKNISDSPLYMLREFLTWEESKDFEIFFATNNMAAHKSVVKSLKLPVKLVDIESDLYAEVLATAKYLVNNSSFPNFFCRRDGQHYIQTWHGTPIKTLGKRMRMGTESMYNVQHNFLQADYITFPNEFTRHVMMRDYNLEQLFTGKMALVGYPRNQVFMDDTAQAMKKKFDLEGTTTLAYMPTWRGISNKSVEVDTYAEELDEILRSIDAVLSDDYEMYVNLHPMVAADVPIKGYQHIFPFPKGADNYQFLSAIDCLITDYSSVFFDYSLTKKPVILFSYDYEKYVENRGVYFDIHDLPFVQIDSLDDLCECVETRSWQNCDYSQSEYANTYLCYDSVDNPKNCMDLLFGREADVVLRDYSVNAEKTWNIIDPTKINSVERLEQVVQRTNPETDIVVFDRNGFTADMSAYLYDNYVDDFNYVFVRRALARTYKEEAMRRLGRADNKDLHDREIRRIFGGLSVNPKFVTRVFWDEPTTTPARVTKMRAPGKKRIVFTVEIADISGYKPEKVVLNYRGPVDDIEAELPFTAKAQPSGGYVLTVDFAPGDYTCFKDIYWDARVIVGNGEEQHWMPIQWNTMKLDLLRLTNTFARIDDKKILFPYGAKSYALAFVCRDINDQDTAAARLKELAAVAVYLIGKPYWTKKNVWLVYEKFCSLAQDNGFYFFQYCMEELPESERKRILYVIDKKAPDYKNVAKYDKNVIQFMSFKHIIYTLAARIYIASDSKSHVYTWRPKPSFVAGVARKKKILFLQHGVTALKQVHPLFGKKGSSPMTYFLTTSRREQDVVVKNFDYTYMQAPVLGFSRWDAIEEKKTPEAPMILIMPTWRPWLEEQSKEAFAASDYCKTYLSLITSPKLEEYLERNNATVNFFIHPKLADQITAFSAKSERIKLIPQGSTPLNQLIMQSSMLITDYSSVCWDVMFMNKPVLFYQFDQQMYEDVTGSYIDLNKDLPGAVCASEEQVFAALEDYASRDFVMSPEIQAMSDEWFDARDHNNRKRTYEFLIERGYGRTAKENAALLKAGKSISGQAAPVQKVETNSKLMDVSASSTDAVLKISTPDAEAQRPTLYIWRKKTGEQICLEPESAAGNEATYRLEFNRGGNLAALRGGTFWALIGPEKEPIRTQDMKACTVACDGFSNKLYASKADALLLGISAIWGRDENTPEKRDRNANRAYKKFRKLPLNEKKIFFESTSKRLFNDNPRAIYEELASRNGTYELIWGLENDKTDVGPGGTPVRYKSLEYWRHMATAKYIVSNMNQYQLVKRPGQVVIQTMHGIPLKHMGLTVAKRDSTKENMKRVFQEDWDYFVTPCDYMSDILRGESYGFKGEFIEAGYPRNDMLISRRDDEEIKRAVRKALEVPEGKKIMLWAPTWRTKKSFNVKLDLERMRQEFADEYVLVVRPHYLEKEFVDSSIFDSFVKNGSMVENANDLTLATDVMITDYSSIMFDFALMGRPMVLFCWDYNKYVGKKRGTYFDLKEDYPGLVAKSTEEVIAKLKDSGANAEAMKQFSRRFNQYETGHASKTVVDYLWPDA